MLVDAYPWAIGFGLASIICGLALHLGPLWQNRRALSVVNAFLIGLSTGLLLVSVNTAIAILVGLTQTYRLFSALRIVQNRVNPKQLRRKTLRSELVLSLWLVVFIIVDATLIQYIYSRDVLFGLICLQLLFAVIFYRHVRFMTHQTVAVLPKKFTPDAELPAITVAIPARNETAELTDCLQSVLRSNYPKLEVLVLDDCSQDKTSDIIRKFAHRGVRFLQGTPPSDAWIAKNHAYDQLLDSASGQYILFCGTDVRFEPNSLRQITEILLTSDIKMLSVLPQRNGPIDKHFLLQPMRYWRELALPRIFDKTPPSLSTCWVADHKMLIKHGGFEALRKTIRPERFIARGVARKGHYKFLRASSGLGINSVKGLPAQWATAVRTRYPEHHNRPEAVFVTSIWHVGILFGPIVSLAAAIVSGHLLLAALAAVATMYLLATHYFVYSMTSGKKDLKPILLYPSSVLLEVVVLNYSMWAYEFSEVIWKGRNVCLPVLATNLRLPKID